MTEIIFRGKEEGVHPYEKAGWIYGYVFKLYGKTCIVHGGNDDLYYEVKEDTVGQYTGLMDKNGKKIFEGDIIKYHDVTGVVKFEYCFYVQWENKLGHTSILPLSDRITLEIIGNIYDNKELLKGE